MGVDFRLPNITAGTPEEQIRQLTSFLYQHINQLSWAFDHIETSTEAPAEENVVSPVRTFNSIKSLIIRDNDISSANLGKAFPVGAIYISVSDTDPAALFGIGAWERIKDTFLLAAGDTYAAGGTGGEATHKLTVDEMPSHKHTIEIIDSSSEATGYGLSSGGGFGNRVVVTGDNNLIETKTTGGSQAHNNMPPYLTVYVWKRIA